MYVECAAFIATQGAGFVQIVANCDNETLEEKIL